MAQIGKDIVQAMQYLQEDGLVAIPTETVYGLAANAFSANAVAKIFVAKNRPSFNPLITHTHDVEQVKRYVKQMPEVAIQLSKTFWPGPLTLLLPKKDIIPDIVTAGSESVAVRIPNHPLTLELLKKLDFPLAAPSANPFGYISPTRAAHVEEQLGDRIDYILDGGECTVGIESTIVGFEEKQVVIYRLGGASLEAIEEIVGRANISMHPQVEDNLNPQAPGMLKSHYAPKKKVIVGNISNLLNSYDKQDIALISLKDYYPQISDKHQVALSVVGDLNEAAQQLFSALRELDKLPVKYIIAEPMPEYGLGKAINDRLQRAAAEKE
ncbi:L-threonylcarbamoyladenylate synthase [Catalinimonas niigatensis]|uniref:L-threonylcarbamoyladenylate synthase n=1 Tax=Catalinimonas niigatensis TaxID=1397264 RepID=UPI0026664B78|nr:L-threonylcarbamoyladenylate synthase [Catalinimonas niigatensis]WPP53061.1 L-threonylcarbamoyladenylate synthase [Catalinimonas niigatensis]